MDVGAVIHALIDTIVVVGMHLLIVNFERLEHQRQVAAGGNVDGIEGGNAVCAAENERSVGQSTHGTVVELVASNAVGGVELGHFAHGAVVFVESVHGADPQIALQVLNDGRHVGARNAVDTFQTAGLEIVMEQSVAVGSYPYLPAHVLVKVGGNKGVAAHAAFPIGLIEGEVAHGKGLGVDGFDVAHEARGEYAPVFER